MGHRNPDVIGSAPLLRLVAFYKRRCPFPRERLGKMSSEIANHVEICVALATVTLLIATPGFAHVERGVETNFVPARVTITAEPSDHCLDN
jgi:hypothetical protein